MFIALDLSHELIRRITNNGWEQKTGYRYSGNTRIFNKRNGGIAVVLPLRLPDGRSSRYGSAIDISEEIERYFRKLAKILGKNKINDIYFQGGGSIMLPDWFIEFCKDNNIKIHILTPENIEAEAENIS